MGMCQMEHTTTCSKCKLQLEIGAQFVKEVRETAEYMISRTGAEDPGSRIELQSIVNTAPRVAEAYRFYLAHRYRAHHQEAFIRNLREGLKEGQVFILTDFKMKILEMFFIESTRQFFGKKGNSLFGSMVFRKVEGEVTWFFLDLALDENSQTAESVMAATTMAIRFVAEYWEGDDLDIILSSDNAACYRSREHLEFVYQLNLVNWLLPSGSGVVKVTDWIFPEAQCGVSFFRLCVVQ